MSDWGFTDEPDARRYLREVRRLWAAWLFGLTALLFTQGWWVVASGVVTIGLLLVLARPLQARAAALVPEDTLVGSRFNVVGRGTERDKALQALAYGREPLEAATTLSGSGAWMVPARSLMVWVTIAAFVYVIATTFSGGDPE
ncbi:MAG TPA: hypothetical protein VLG28_17835 [Acidimicrobiia bacterium]|jgi:hypothetical protein|nr:hypothetical protein [Acidimicrobiia bacterium]